MTGQFAMLPAWLLRCCHDARAIQLYGHLCLYARDWRVALDIETLATELRCSRRSTKRALQLLRRLGGVRTVKRRDAGGLFIGVDVTLAGVVGPFSMLTIQGPRAAPGLEGTRGQIGPHPRATRGPTSDLDLYVDLDQKAVVASATTPPAYKRKRYDPPTGKQIERQVHELMAGRNYRYEGGETDLQEDLKQLLADRGFDYSADLELLHRAFESALAQAHSRQRRAAR